MTYYTYRQNNSGGFFIAPAINLVVKADTLLKAELIAIANGVYFDPEFRHDCECCGQRWYSDPDVSDTIPEVHDWDKRFAAWDNIPVQIIIE
jgi:hypothetical protein